MVTSDAVIVIVLEGEQYTGINVITLKFSGRLPTSTEF